MLKSPYRAVQHYRIAAKRGDPYAKMYLALAYAEGQGIAQDLGCPSADRNGEALTLLVAGTNQALLPCSDCLFLAGEGLYQRNEFGLAAHYWRQAAERGDTVAMFHLADAIRGSTIPADNPKIEAAGWSILSRMERGEEGLEMARLRTDGLSAAEIEAAQNGP